MLSEGLICPECKTPLKEEDLKESLVCASCKTDLQNAKYLDFIEYLVANGIVKDIDFFDMKIYKDGKLWLSGGNRKRARVTPDLVRLGSGRDNNNFWHGLLDDLAILSLIHI